MIQKQHLANYQNRALGICAYGAGGLRKTLTIRTLPPPIIVYDFEGGSGCLGPWTRRVRLWSESTWTEYDQARRESIYSMVSEEAQKTNKLPPAPLIDVVSYDDVFSMSQDGKNCPAYDNFFEQVANFDIKRYNSVAIDPLIEMSQLTQSRSKVGEGVSAMEPMVVKYWQGAQERAGIILRRLRNYRDQGVFTYMTCGEFVDKDYGTDPRSKAPGQVAEEPYAIKGTINVPGKLVGTVQHMLDILCHARMQGGSSVWVTREEAARSGSFNWEAKDRTGRIAEKYIVPNVYSVVKWVYGAEAAKAIYQES